MINLFKKFDFFKFFFLRYMVPCFMFQIPGSRILVKSSESDEHVFQVQDEKFRILRSMLKVLESRFEDPGSFPF